MFANAKTFFIIASCMLVAHAQSSDNASATATAPASPSSAAAVPDSCITNCLSATAAEYGCGTYTNLTCVCTSTAFQQIALRCLQQECTPQDVATATQMQEAACGGSNSSSVPASTAASTAASSGTSSTPTSATSSSAAMALSAPLSLSSLVGTLVASAGALVGAAFVL